jgi:hypothetical protein
VEEYNGKIVSIEKLHELASNEKISHISLSKESVSGDEIGQADKTKQFSKWTLGFNDGCKISVYV